MALQEFAKASASGTRFGGPPPASGSSALSARSDSRAGARTTSTAGVRAARARRPAGLRPWLARWANQSSATSASSKELARHEASARRRAAGQRAHARRTVRRWELPAPCGCRSANHPGFRRVRQLAQGLIMASHRPPPPPPPPPHPPTPRAATADASNVAETSRAILNDPCRAAQTTPAYNQRLFARPEWRVAAIAKRERLSSTRTMAPSSLLSQLSEHAPVSSSISVISAPADLVK
jgi:hypothetical protein